MANPVAFIARIPITAMPRRMSRVTIRPGSASAAIMCRTLIALPVGWKRRLVFSWLRVELDVVGDAHARDHLELALQRVDMLLFILEDVGEEIPAHIVADGFAMLDCAAKLGQRLHLQFEVGLQYLLDA